MVLGKFTKEALKANVKVHAKFILNFFFIGPITFNPFRKGKIHN